MVCDNTHLFIKERSHYSFTDFMAGKVFHDIESNFESGGRANKVHAFGLQRSCILIKSISLVPHLHDRYVNFILVDTGIVSSIRKAVSVSNGS